MAKQDDYIKTALRIPRVLHSQLMESSASRGRSLNAEFIERLDSSFEAKDQSALAQRVAHLELELLTRQLDLAWFSTLISDVSPHIPQELAEANPDLKANLKMLGRFSKRFSLGKDALERMDRDHEDRLRQALSEMMEKKPFNPPQEGDDGAPPKTAKRAPHKPKP